MVERNMNNAVMRGIVVPPGSRATSRAQGSRRNLGALVSGRQALRLPRARERPTGSHQIGRSRLWKSRREVLLTVLRRAQSV
jgi:hypothetical protein